MEKEKRFGIIGGNHIAAMLAGMPPIRLAVDSANEVENWMARLVAVGVGIAHANRCSKIGFALGTKEIVPNHVTCCNFLEDCYNRILSGMPLEDFCAYIDDFEDLSIGIKAAQRKINTPYIIERVPISISFDISENEYFRGTLDLPKSGNTADKAKQKNALGFLPKQYGTRKRNQSQRISNFYRK